MTSNRFLVPVGIVSLSAPPDAPVVGETYFDTTLGQLRSWDGTAWVGSSSDAELDGQFVNVPGDGMTGELVLPDQVAAPPSVPAVVAAKAYVDQLVTVSNAPPTVPPARDGLVWSVVGLSVNGSPVDPATQAFFNASGLDESFAPALDGLVLGLKAAGLWSKMLAIYPFIGGTADLHKWNLKDPRDADDAYRLTFTGGAHSLGLGYRPNPEGGGINGNYADTHLIPRGIFDQDSTHLSYYSLAKVPFADRCEMGCYQWDDGSGQRFHIIANYIAGEFYYGMAEDGITAAPGTRDSDGFFVATRTASNAQAGYVNGALVGSSTAPSIWLPDVPIHVGAINYFANRSDLPCGFASVGTGLTAQDVTDFNTVVQAYQTALGRAVG